MADLMTRIGADDAEFQRGMDRMNNRLTGIGRAAGLVSKVMKGVGVVGIANFAVGIITQLDDVRKQAEKTSEALEGVGASAVKSLKDKAGSLRGQDMGPREIRDSAYEKIKEAEKTANDQIVELQGKSFLGKAALEIYNRAIGADEVTVEAMIAKIQADKDRTIREINGAANDTVAAWAEKTQRERAQRIKDSQDDLDKDFQSKLKQETENRIKLSGTLNEMQVRALRDSGAERDAAMMEQAQKSQKLRDAITQADYLSNAERRDAWAAAEMSDINERAGIDQRFQSMYASRAGSVNGAVGVGGATFVQQLGLMNRPLTDHAKEIASNTKATADTLGKLSTKLSASATYN